VDRKDAIIQMLDRDLEEADEQHQMALRSHLMNVDALITLQRSRLEAMESHFERDLHMIEKEFRAESDDMRATHKRTAKEMRDVNEAIQDEIERQEQELRTDFEGLQADYRGKHEEEKQVVKVTLENAVNEFERQLDNAYNTYYDSTKKQTEKYRELQSKDQKDSRKIDGMQRKCARLTESLQHWRTKISNNMKEAESRNKALKEEKDKVIGHYQELKGRMNRVRDAEDKRLTDLTLNARGTIGDLTDKLTMAERILKLAELNRKLMTEREKVVPFEHSVAEDMGADDMMKASADHQPGSAATLGSDGKPVEEWLVLNQFFTRFNKILLDKVAMDAEDNRLSNENERLRGLIKQFVDGISVNDDVMQNTNALMVVNNSLPHLPRNEGPEPTCVDGPRVIHLMEMQQR